MDEPPFLIDGARVRAFAAIAKRDAHAVADGIAIEGVTRIALTENLADGLTFLLFCNDAWETLGAESHRDVPAAERAAQWQFPGIEWRAYRALTQAEAEELETTRAFLQSLV